GANLGSRIDIFLQLGARVLAVEPQHKCNRYLRLKYGNRHDVTLVQKGLDAQPGTLELYVAPDDSATASMSVERISAVTNARKLPEGRCSQTQVVPVPTLDSLVAEFGEPAFCKIDVEGYEFQVLKGLSRPLNSLSFEYTPEYISPALSCVRHLAALGTY